MMTNIIRAVSLFSMIYYQFACRTSGVFLEMGHSLKANYRFSDRRKCWRINQNLSGAGNLITLHVTVRTQLCDTGTAFIGLNYDRRRIPR